jgi:hypothetical protein
MPDRVIAVVKDWGRQHQKEDKKQALSFLNQTKKLYNWDNDDLEDNKGLVESDIAHPDLPAEFPGIDLESEQPHCNAILCAPYVNRSNKHQLAAYGSIMRRLANCGHDVDLQILGNEVSA